jgi:meso-butanediol dehydrogenase/(S,S)-butanediol dehydrogenase/diacetyl reductase
MELQGQAAIVTGGGRGIGLATALELARLGADIVIAELDATNAERAAAEVRATGRRAIGIATDVTSRPALDQMVQGTLAAFGRLDILVNNAGIYRTAPVLEVTEDHWDAIMTINAKAVFFAAQAVLPEMIARKRGVIVNLASMAGKIGSPDSLPYCASKAAVVSMTKSLALAHAADGIRVNCVCPGFVETDMWSYLAQERGARLGQTGEEFSRQARQRIPLGRMERAEDVANLIGFLTTPRADYMTGQALSLDGGLVMHG